MGLFMPGSGGIINIMEQLLKTLLRIPEAEALAQAVEQGGCPAAVSCRTGRPLIMVCSDETEAVRLAGDLALLLNCKPLQLFARELFVRAGTVISRLTTW